MASSTSQAAGVLASGQMLLKSLFSEAEEAFAKLWNNVDARDITEKIVHYWILIRVAVIAPLLRAAIYLSLAMTVMILAEKLFVGGVSLAVKVFRLKPQKRYNWVPMHEHDLELGSLAYPMVLVQIPMYNEKEVYKLSIGAACALDWPTDRMIVQVLDDSTDPVIKDLVEMECQKWKSKGINITYEVRDNREGYKAGALKEGMKHPYVKDCDYVAMFDADFQPEPDFLMRTIPFLIHNPEVALVQSRWKFVNADECIMTQIQEMSLNYHFKIEQEAGSSTSSFFGFNGTAGVWRIKAIDDAGGWKDRTTVEDMDLAVRAGLEGWKFVYVGDVKVKSELPSTFKAYRFQQHRWSCGPANLFKKMAMEIIKNKKVSIWKKMYLLYSFFFLGKVVSHTATFIFYCIVIPMTVYVPEVHLPLWGVVYAPTTITLLKAVATPRSIHLVILWIIFENVMSLHRLKACLTGLAEFKRVNEWVVTEKLGDANKEKPLQNEVKDTEQQGENQMTKPLIEKGEEIQETKPFVEKSKKVGCGLWKRFYFKELVMAFLLIFSGFYDLFTRRQGFFVYLFLQGLGFLVVGVGYIGTYVPS